MKIKRFLDKDSRSAMSRIRTEMGADAVILSSKNINGQVELVAAMDFDERDLSAVERQITDAKPEQPEVPSQSPTLEDLQRELGNLRGLLEGELAQLAWRDMAERPSVKAALYSRLNRFGLSRVLCNAITDKLPTKGDLEQLWKSSLELLSRRLSVTGDRLLNEGGVVALVGSTGVGKTTTIAKLAARFVMRHGAREVGLITTDCYRIGGQEQLETFADYLGIPMIVATDGGQLKAALDQFSGKKLVLIDTAGMSQRDVRLYEQFQTLKSVGYPIDAYVVLSATAQYGALREIIQVFGRAELAGAMITKTDECAELGGLIDLVIKSNLALAYVSSGQKVPEDIAPARVESLMDKAVKLMEEGVVREEKRHHAGPQIRAMAV
ncbi:flagellar biosynthesis protein FlhF [Porticoccus sp.]